MDLKITTYSVWTMIMILFFCGTDFYALLWLSVFPALASVELLTNKELK